MWSAKQRTVAGRVQWCYVGIGLLETHPDERETGPDASLTHFTGFTGFTHLLFIAREKISGEKETRSPQEQDRANPVNPVNLWTETATVTRMA